MSRSDFESVLNELSAELEAQDASLELLRATFAHSDATFEVSEAELEEIAQAAAARPVDPRTQVCGVIRC
ncbi:MAG: hypothetical protein IPI67_35120 [Myxococcales bacterium]|nr:hypothetical protein [Myxococcales bacterium]